MEVTISNQRVLVDKEDWFRLSLYPWHIETGHGYVVYRDRDKHKFYLHRMVMNAPADSLVDHINRNKLDNRRLNLRLSSSRRNVLNQDWAKGISLLKSGKWRAYVTITGKNTKRQLHLGHFSTKHEAELATKTARKVLERVYSVFDL